MSELPNLKRLSADVRYDTAQRLAEMHRGEAEIERKPKGLIGIEIPSVLLEVDLDAGEAMSYWDPYTGRRLGPTAILFLEHYRDEIQTLAREAQARDESDPDQDADDPRGDV